MPINYSQIAEAHRLVDELDGYGMKTIQEKSEFKFVIWGGKHHLTTSSIEEVLDFLYTIERRWDRSFEKETKVWFLDCTMREGVICHGKIIKYSDVDAYVVQTEDGRQMTVPENCLYLSKKSLIEDCLDYWATQLAEYEDDYPHFALPKKNKTEGLKQDEIVPVEGMRPKFEGEVKGFNHCEHDYDALRDDNSYKFSRYMNGTSYYVSHKDNDVYCGCGMPADFPHSCKCRKCGEEKKLRCECGALADYLHICSYSTDSNSNKDSCDHIYAGGGSGHDLSQMSMKCSKCGKNFGGVIHKASLACEHETEQGGCGGDLMFKCKKCGEFYR